MTQQSLSTRPYRAAARAGDLDHRTGQPFSKLVTVMAVPVLPVVWPLSPVSYGAVPNAIKIPSLPNNPLTLWQALYIERSCCNWSQGNSLSH